MQRFTAALVALSFSLAGASTVHADPVVLASGEIFFHGGGGGPEGSVDPSATGTFYMSWFVGPEAPLPTRLFNVTLTPDDIGRTLRETAGPAFDLAAARLTNTENDMLKHALTFPDDRFITASLFESSLFLTSVGGPPDLTGFAITALTFRLTDLLVTDDDDSREVRYSGVVSVEGLAADPVPEPSTLFLIGTGAAVMMRRARRRGTKMGTPTRLPDHLPKAYR